MIPIEMLSVNKEITFRSFEKVIQSYHEMLVTKCLPLG